MRRVLLVAGGTGGHIWPAISFGEWIRRTRPEVHVSYLAGTRTIERDIYHSAGIEPHLIGVEGSPLGGGKGQRRRRWLQQLRGIFQTRDCFREEDPDICVLFGGYVCVPALFLCRFQRTPCIFHEQNARSGRVTRLARHMGIPIATGFSLCEPFEKGSFYPVGVPIRRFRRLPDAEAWTKLGIGVPASEGPVVAVMAGSLGSSPLTDAVRELVRRPGFRGWTFLVLGGASFLVAEEENLFLLPRLWEPDPILSVADLLIVRAGASTLAEVASLGKPAVVAPWSASAGDHQRRNASAFVEEWGGFVWDEKAEGVRALEAYLKKLRERASLSRPRREIPGPDDASERLWERMTGFARGEGRG